ncbi:DNA-J protein [Trypanosoma grayi]|uniref:DNA-J protein n=1 Tax=Trypanosoma grayi TaxID=71804 RepID=UPI0004F4AFE8|nr:DNA-J protein [Trypanosoma grayi]KEG14087.1 DNA-J protein [Trypanosoma grayi]
MFQAAQTAYEVLSNEQSRLSYNAELDRERSMLRGFKRPPPLDKVRHPVHYKLADGEYYEFEAAPDKLKCTFKHGDIIDWNSQLGCFIGMAADDFLYWCRDGHKHASKLCQRGSFGVDTVKVLVRANFKSMPRGQKRYPVHATATAASSPSGTRRDSGEETGEVNDAKPPPPNTATAARGGRGGRPSEAERLRRDILRRELQRHLQERMAEVVEDEKKRRVRLIEKIEAALEDRRQAFQDWIAAGGVLDGEEPAWITHAK